MALTIIFALFDVDNTPFDTVFGHSLWNGCDFIQLVEEI